MIKVTRMTEDSNDLFIISVVFRPNTGYIYSAVTNQVYTIVDPNRLIAVLTTNNEIIQIVRAKVLEFVERSR